MRLIHVLILGFVALHVFESNAQLIPQDEVKVLQAISDKLENLNWTVTQHSCVEDGGFNGKMHTDDDTVRNVTCDCKFQNNTVCHVDNIFLKAQNIAGVFPSEFGNLTHLKVLDLTRNYINGSLPKSFPPNATLTNLSLLGNRLSGPIPSEIGDIANLEELVLDCNQLEGPLPSSLGNLSNLKRLLLSANNFTGTIPESFGKLKNLTEFRIDGSSLSGPIPSFIGNWTKLDRLDLQGTNMEGPIPSTISQLKLLTELRITDLKRPTMNFPNLEELKNMKRLVLRNCLITGDIPDYIAQMSNLKTLDLSFNMLTGPVPDSIQNLNNLDYLFLTNNSLSGEIQDWILSFKQNIDLSNNNFTKSSASSCQLSAVNLASSHSSSSSVVTTTSTFCLKRNLPCAGQPQYKSLFINCGGGEGEFEGNNYVGDLHQDGISNFDLRSEGQWAYSSTGVFMGNDKANYIAQNALSLNISGPDYYQNARLSPMSLNYYGLCMQNGNYKVKLHFAEIMYTDDQTYRSLGRRIFDVSVQGFRYLQDFNIVEEAGGVGKGITKEFDVDVHDGTLEIHLYWAGKGTTSIPDRGVYGPLISAIEMIPNFENPSKGLSAGVIAGIVAASCGFVILILVVLWKMGLLCRKDTTDRELLDMKTGYYSLRQIKTATNNFDPANKIGEGGFGPVYKGVLSDGDVIAVKQLSSKSKQGNREFVNEIGMISALQHPNLVKLYGCCIEGNQLLLIYEYMENNSLARALFGEEEQKLHLDWPTRMKICVGIARGLAYLHEESRLKIVHRDIKATNVLLDRDLNAKISDFGLAKLDEEENTHISTRIAGFVLLHSSSALQSLSNLTMATEQVLVDEIPYPSKITTTKPLSLLGHGITDMEIHFIHVKFYSIGVYFEPEVVSHLQQFKGKPAKELEQNDEFFDALISAPVEKFIRLVVIKEIKGAQYGVQIESAVRDRLAAEDKYEEEEEEALEKVIEFFQSKYFKKHSVITYHFPANSATAEIVVSLEGKEDSKFVLENANVVEAIKKWYIGGSTAVSTTTIQSLASTFSEELSK